ncbi:MAG: HNH endonuclease [Chitinivibrionales bacterium]|nr:HNH endonuclease [Chitinivibrionales bacterium]MBD3356936.1 HNH endonuclease [Chitinivibrionales bacterium]
MNRHRKYDLPAKILEAITDDGWTVIYLEAPKLHPFRIRIHKGSESFNVRIYVWHLTHGGGKMRPADEYRVQITGVDRFEKEPDGLTLILGWWESGQVFAGFDIERHSGPLGFSPSIQIREEALRKAYENGFAPWVKDNQEIAIAFHQDFLAEYIRNVSALHTFGESDTDYEVLEGVSERPDEINDTVLATVSAPRKTTVAQVARKVRDNGFKARVLNAYAGKCAFCGLQLRLVDAAHILPVSHEHSTDDTPNGLALCALHHRAYDKGLVTLNSKYQVLHNAKMAEKLKAEKLDGGLKRFLKDLRDVIVLPPAVNDRPHIDFIRESNTLRGWKRAS